MNEYKFKWSVEGSLMYDSCIASSLDEAAEIISRKNKIPKYMLEIDEDED